MNLFIVVTTRRSGPLLKGLAEACGRKGMTWSVFFTGEGVALLHQQECLVAMKGADAAVACGESWSALYQELDCPVEIGSQLNNSMMVGKASRVISL